MANTHTADVTLEPSPAIFTCDDEVEFKVKIEHTSGDPIKEVRIYDGALDDYYTDTPPHTDFVCGAPPAGWALEDQTLTFNYCQYQALIPLTEFVSGDIEEFTFKAKLTTQSNYKWGVETYDLKNSWLSHELPITVDCTAPTTTKEFDGPFKEDNGVEWIDGVTQIVLDAEDDVEHNSGVDKTWYRNILLTDENECWYPNQCQPSSIKYDVECVTEKQDYCSILFNRETQFDEWADCVENSVHDDEDCDLPSDWHLYRGEPISKDQESCHKLEFFSVDNVGNVEDVNANCFFVDKTPPEVSKEHGENAIEGTDPNLPINGTFHWANPETNITFTCTDQEPHPSEMEELCFKVSYDMPQYPTYLTNDYCTKYGGNLKDGYCCVPATPDVPFVFNFNENEDSIHDLEYYCRDGVDKKSDVRIQYYKVDDTPPTIKKEMLGSWLGDCPPTEEVDRCYVADNGNSGVSIWVEDRGLICAVDNVKCSFELWWETSKTECDNAGGEYNEVDGKCLIDSGLFGGLHKDIFFKEDSTHELIVHCEDALGNSVDDREEFLVDSTPPITIKEYGEPYKADPKCVDLCQGDIQCIHQRCTQWISSQTPITLTANDNKVGVDKTWYYDVLVDDKFCDDPLQFCQPVARSPYDDPALVDCINLHQDICSQGLVPGDPAWIDCVQNGVLLCPNFDPNWRLYNGPFKKSEESCHIIEYFSVDKLGNVELRNHQCVFVDNTPPEPVKEIGEHKFLICPDGNDLGGDFSVNAVGDVVHEIDVSSLVNPGYTNFCSVGLAFDGTSLYYNRCNDQNIYKIHPITGALQDTFDTEVNYPNAMAYDKKRNGIWFGSQQCDSGNMPIYFWDFDDDSVNVEFTILNSLINPATGESFLGFCFVDGLAYNENDPDTDADDEIWFSDDVNRNLGLFRPDGTLVTGYNAALTDPSLSSLSGLAVGGPNLYLGNDGGGGCFQS